MSLAVLDVLAVLGSLGVPALFAALALHFPRLPIINRASVVWKVVGLQRCFPRIFSRSDKLVRRTTMFSSSFFNPHFSSSFFIMSFHFPPLVSGLRGNITGRPFTAARIAPEQ